MSRTRTQAACLKASVADLLAFNFREGPVFRQRFDAHVVAYKRAMSWEVFRRYFASPTFAAAYHSELEERASRPLPPMRSCA